MLKGMTRRAAWDASQPALGSVALSDLATGAAANSPEGNSADWESPRRLSTRLRSS